MKNSKIPNPPEVELFQSKDGSRRLAVVKWVGDVATNYYGASYEEVSEKAQTAIQTEIDRIAGKEHAKATRLMAVVKKKFEGAMS